VRWERDEVATVQLRPIQKQTLAKAAMQRLLELIQGGSLVPGDALPSQHELARQLGVSRPVLREAMQGLASAGLVEIRAGSGCYVADPTARADPEALFEVVTHEAALETIEARLVVEVELAALAAERMTAADRRAIEAILARLKRAVGRGQQTAAITSDFHRALARAGHNAVLDKMARVLGRPRLAQGVRVEHALPDIAAGEYDSHRKLYEEIGVADPDRARAAMRRHLEIAHGWEDEINALRRRIDA
jgi:GntR family transcriptional repressor for pyruvate dehydrogenase complex